jgi:hypothetical protein
VTLAVILAFAIVGYVMGGDVRKQAVDLEIGGPQPTALPPDLPPAP